MSFFLEDPVLFWLVWGIFTLAGTIIGWSLRANTSEKEVRGALGRIEQEKNTLARLYTQIKHLKKVTAKHTAVGLQCIFGGGIIVIIKFSCGYRVHFAFVMGKGIV